MCFGELLSMRTLCDAYHKERTALDLFALVLIQTEPFTEKYNLFNPSWPLALVHNSSFQSMKQLGVLLLSLIAILVHHRLLSQHFVKLLQKCVEVDIKMLFILFFFPGMVLYRHDSETTFTPEEILGMILNHSRIIAEKFAGEW